MFMGDRDDVQMIFCDCGDVFDNQVNPGGAALILLMHAAINENVAGAAVRALKSQQETVAKAGVIHTDGYSRFCCLRR